ncbi:hypothetical protein KL942_000427 [Ogataea angusta]|uniref:Large ribosomal subunit protein uL6 alpha-beta domain-containing protein n=1 Tax=Pichia angusta TaxID=870730 RepID=A0AAN6DK46_PICAN|nr:uncharacterized protein KL928_001223 [Ogataea angusta]KAG7821139.1 hypothetical protein KL928_001223 [Ogataea angusta]KAG7826160.1 hypothetical protein KL909_000212 [Ogataea angusta]KAG7832094.1 hypothetical protein KL920_000429 [Ogataea angusta]KAG7836266.1 hypothetical protein KL943_001915 [Ogataea angusta]KAG7843331.1 hypothetical protein KL942_000427 [Ogataea angusta]
MSFVRRFSSLRPVLSHIGSAPIVIPPQVEFEFMNLLVPKFVPKGAKSMRLDRVVTVKGPKGKIDLALPEFVQVQSSGGRAAVTVKKPEDKLQKQLWGTMRALLNNGVVGVTEGHTSTLKLQGTGYRAMLEDVDGVKWVKMKIGKCDLQGLPIPDGITVTAPTQTLLILEGCDKQQLNLFAASLRNMHPPERYKGKGVYLNGETIKLKDKKVK